MGDYQIFNRLGAGASGEVFRAWHIPLRRELALKLLTGVADDDEVRTRFVREGRMLARISDAHVLKVFDVGLMRGRLFLALELIEGSCLMSRLRTSPALTPKEALAVARDCARGLAAIHAAGIIHRDVKPSNVFLRPGFGAVVGDLGFAKDSDITAGLTAAGIFVGTPAYASPESCRGEELTPSSDLFALGLVLLECLGVRLGVKADPGQMFYQRATIPLEIPLGLDEQVHERLPDVLSRVLAFDPASRMASAAALAEELDGMLRDNGRSVTRTSVKKSARVTPVVPTAAPAPSPASISEPARSWRFARGLAAGSLLCLPLVLIHRGTNGPERTVASPTAAGIQSCDPADNARAGERLVTAAIRALDSVGRAVQRQARAGGRRVEQGSTDGQLVSRFAEVLELLARVLALEDSPTGSTARVHARPGGRLIVQAYRAAAEAERRFKDAVLTREDRSDPDSPGAIAELVATEAEPARLRRSLALVATKFVARVEHLLEADPDPVTRAGLAVLIAYSTFAKSDSRVRKGVLSRAETLALRAWPGLISDPGPPPDAADAVGAVLEMLRESGARGTHDELLMSYREAPVAAMTGDAEAAHELLHYEIEAARIETELAPTAVHTPSEIRKKGFEALEALRLRLETSAGKLRRTATAGVRRDELLEGAYAHRLSRVGGQASRVKSQLGL